MADAESEAYWNNNPDVAASTYYGRNGSLGADGARRHYAEGGHAEGRVWPTITTTTPPATTTPSTTTTPPANTTAPAAGLFDSVTNFLSGIPTPVKIGGALVLGYMLFVGEDKGGRRR